MSQYNMNPKIHQYKFNNKEDHRTTFLSTHQITQAKYCIAWLKDFRDKIKHVF
jgi:hypothetical protein